MDETPQPAPAPSAEPTTEITTSQPEQIEVYRAPKGALGEILKQVLNLSTTGVFHEPTCGFCHSKSRAEAEALWRQHNGVGESRESVVRKLFLSVGEDISVDLIRHHIKNHLDRGEAELRKVEHINKIAALNTIRVSTIDQVDMLLSACWERLISIGEMEATSPARKLAVEAQKNKDTAALMKVVSQLLSLRAQILGEMKGRGELVSIPADKFTAIFNKHLSQVSTKEDKQRIANIFDELAKANTQ